LPLAQQTKEGVSPSSLFILISAPCCIKYLATSFLQRLQAIKKAVKGRLIEIETHIDQRDFKDLWSVCKNKLHKIRVYIEVINYGGDHCYFYL
jgi:hypothetical protein